MTGQWLSRINPNSIEELEVITAGAGVEFGRAQGGFARIIQKQGNNTHEGVFEFYWRTSKLDGHGAKDPSAAPDPEFDTWQPMIQLSGPLKRDKLWYRLSYERRETEIPVNVLSRIEIIEQTAETRDAQLTWQLSPRNKLALQFRGDPVEATNVGVNNQVSSESSRRTDRDVETWSVNWTAPYSPKVLAETTLAWQDVSPASGPSTAGLLNDCVPNATGAFLNEAYCTDLSHNTVSGSSPTTISDHRQRLTLKSQATVYGGRFWGMTHQFKVGLNVENERYFRDLTIRPSIYFSIIDVNLDDEQDEDDEPDIDSFGVVLSRLAVPQSDEVRATGTNWALYAEDQFKPLQNLTLTLGGPARQGGDQLRGPGAVRPAGGARRLHRACRASAGWGTERTGPSSSPATRISSPSRVSWSTPSASRATKMSTPPARRWCWSRC